MPAMRTFVRIKVDLAIVKLSELRLCSHGQHGADDIRPRRVAQRDRDRPRRELATTWREACDSTARNKTGSLYNERR